jgi:hypothetical protein
MNSSLNKILGNVLGQIKNGQNSWRPGLPRTVPV